MSVCVWVEHRIYEIMKYGAWRTRAHKHTTATTPHTHTETRNPNSRLNQFYFSVGFFLSHRILLLYWKFIAHSCRRRYTERMHKPQQRASEEEKNGIKKKYDKSDLVRRSEWKYESNANKKNDLRTVRNKRSEIYMWTKASQTECRTEHMQIHSNARSASVDHA